MSDLNLYLRISTLPDQLKTEILDYMDSILLRRLKQKNRFEKHPKAGCMKGTFKMSPDFDEPLDDFKEYM